MTEPSPPLRSQPDRRPAVAQVVETLDTGGAENLAVQLANALAARGWRSHLYVLAGPGDLSERVGPEVRLRHLEHRRRSIGDPVGFGLSVQRGLRLLRARLRDDGVQVMQTHLPAANFWGLALAMSGAVHSIATVHNNDEFSYGSRHGLRLRLRKAAYGQMLRHCAAMVCVSEEVRASLLRQLAAEGSALAGRAVVVPNGVQVPEPLPAAERQRLRAAQGVDDATVLVLAVGRLCEQKNFKDLVAAASLLPASGPWRILIAGEGPDRVELEGRIAAANLGQRVRLLGNVAAMTALMRAADLFVLPSLWEGLPLSLLEAMACRLPVVGNRIRGIAEIVSPDRSALLVEPGDARGLAEAIAALLPDGDRRRRLGEAGHSIVKQHFDFERTVDRLESLYAAALAASA